MKHGKLPPTDEEVAERIANLKGKELEEFIADYEAVLAFVNKRLQEPNHSAKMVRAYLETKKTIEDLLDVIDPNRSN